MKGRSRGHCNRLLVLCTSINDVTAWPFWKFLQLKKICGVTDMAMLAFNSGGGSFEARIDGRRYTLKNYANVIGYRKDMLERFIHRWHDPGRSYFVYGGHGMGDYLEFEQGKVSLQVHELATILGRRRFEAMVFDACFMANLDCAYHLRHNTRYIGASEGYMWEPDAGLDYHIFNTHTASAMCRQVNPKNILHTIQRDYCDKAARGDFAVLDTTHVAALRAYVEAHVMPRVYNRATFYNKPQLARLHELAEHAMHEGVRRFGPPGGHAYLEGMGNIKTPSPNATEALALTSGSRASQRQRLRQAVQLEHSLYPSEVDDRHLVDLRAYLTDMALEEDARASVARGGARWLRASAASPQLERPPRVRCVDHHGVLPPYTPIPPSPVFFPGAAGGPFAPGSAHEGLDLFHKVVLSHRAPRAAELYATHLGGLSLAVHEASHMSRPLLPWRVNRATYKAKAREFIKRGFLPEVRVHADGPTGAATLQSSTRVQEGCGDNNRASVVPRLPAAGAAPPRPTPIVYSTNNNASVKEGPPPEMLQQGVAAATAARKDPPRAVTVDPSTAV